VVAVPRVTPLRGSNNLLLSESLCHRSPFRHRNGGNYRTCRIQGVAVGPERGFERRM